ncbi:MAG: hypothetical protein AAB486_03060 [Patescibacteria group bacterium]
MARDLGCKTGHGKFYPCTDFVCDDCGGAICQQTSRRVQYVTGSTGIICAECAKLYPECPEEQGEWSHVLI